MTRATKGRGRVMAAGLIVAVSLAVAPLLAAGWTWQGQYGPGAVELLIIGDVQIHTRRADPSTALHRMRDTLRAADLVYANLEGLLVPSVGTTIDIPDKPEWTHPGPAGAAVLKASNLHVVGVANNVASGRANILKSLVVLEAQGIAHVGAGRNRREAHVPAIVERKGVKIGFLQYTARWYRDADMIATETEAGVARLSSKDGITIDPEDVAQVKADIQALRPKVDIVVVSHHNRDGSTPVQFNGTRGTSPVKGREHSEPYQQTFARMAIDLGADLVFGHGTHTIQGVEVYQGRPILYAIGHSNFDQPGYEKATDGLVVRVVIEGKRIVRTSFVPVTKDAANDVYMLDPTTGEGARLVRAVTERSPAPPALRVDGQEVVLIDRPPVTRMK